MSYIEFDEDEWLVSLTRAIAAFVTTELADPDVMVEMSFPDTRDWTKTSPLNKCYIHFEQDDIDDPPVGLGIPFKATESSSTDDPDENDQVTVEYIAKHVVNYDCGVWVSAEMGGATKRMEVVQALKNLFVPASAKAHFQTVTNGPYVREFSGGANMLDRVNDIPVWRASGMTLVVECFSRHVPATPTIWIPMDTTQDPELVIDVNGALTPLATDGS